MNLDAADEERVAHAEGLHEGVQRALELRGQRPRLLGRLRARLDGLVEELQQELKLRARDHVEQVVRERVAVLLQKRGDVVMHNAGKVGHTCTHATTNMRVRTQTLD